MYDAEYHSEYYKKNKDKMLAYNNKYNRINVKRLSQYRKKYREKNKDKARKQIAQWSKTPKGCFSHYKCRAKYRGKLFKISFEDFNTFWQQPCSYCGASIATIGLDRMDNQKGYLIGNVTPCCWPCNKKKGPKDVDTFIKSLKII